MVITERIVLANTIFEASSLSAPYLSASIEVVTPAGMPFKITDMLETMGSRRSKMSIPIMAKGITTRRINVNKYRHFALLF